MADLPSHPATNGTSKPYPGPISDLREHGKHLLRCFTDIQDRFEQARREEGGLDELAAIHHEMVLLGGEVCRLLLKLLGVGFRPNSAHYTGMSLLHQQLLEWLAQNRPL